MGLKKNRFLSTIEKFRAAREGNTGGIQESEGGDGWMDGGVGGIFQYPGAPKGDTFLCPRNSSVHLF